jgi:DNA-binding LytR/AlgR family response regulator
MNCLIIDHDNSSAGLTGQMAARVEDLYVSGVFDNALDAFNYLQVNKVDLLFIEIEMPGIGGLELARNLAGRDMVIIFTAAIKDYAAEAYELKRSDYLLKPVAPDRFSQAVNKAREIIMQRKKKAAVPDNECLFIRDSTIIRKLRVEDILYAQAMGDYVCFFTSGKFYAIHGKLKKAEERLPASKFLRVHRSYIVSLNKIETVEDRGITIGGKFLPVAEAYKRGLNQRMNIIW